MQIQTHTDHNIEGHEGLAARVTGALEKALGHHSDRITRVVVHLSDENADKGGGKDMRCMMEARLERQQSIAITHYAAGLDQVINGAAHKLARLVESTVGRQRDKKNRTTDPSPTEPEPPVA